jgi:hypothetical protein
LPETTSVHRAIEVVKADLEKMLGRDVLIVTHNMEFLQARRVK